VASALVPGEEVHLHARPHGAALARPLARPLVLVAIGVVLVVVGSPFAWALGIAGALALGGAALLALVAVWRWDRTRLVLTSEKLFVVDGIARRRAAAVRLARVPALEFEQGVIGRVLGYGTLVAGDFEVPYVPDPGRVRALLG
jgi:membrane protein YdbS with pleckstrin-like domain